MWAHLCGLLCWCVLIRTLKTTWWDFKLFNLFGSLRPTFKNTNAQCIPSSKKINAVLVYYVVLTCLVVDVQQCIKQNRPCSYTNYICKQRLSTWSLSSYTSSIITKRSFISNLKHRTLPPKYITPLVGKKEFRWNEKTFSLRYDIYQVRVSKQIQEFKSSEALPNALKEISFLAEITLNSPNLFRLM